MPTPRRSRLLERAAYARNPNTNGGFLVNDPEGFPSAYPPALWWVGLDSGGGAYPIGPNGPWSSGAAAAAIPVVTRATALITGPLTTAPFRVVDEGRPLPVPKWLTDPMLVRQDLRVGVQELTAVRRLVRSVFWTEWLRSTIWWGLGAFVYKLAKDGPAPGSMYVVAKQALSTVRRESQGGRLCWVLNPYDMQPVEFNQHGVLSDDPGDDGRDVYGNIKPNAWHICVLRNPHSPVDTEGMSQGVFELSPAAFNMAGSIAQYSSGQFRAGVPNGYLKTAVPGMTQEAADALKARWMAAHGGDRRSIAVLNSTTEFVPINLSPVDAALGEVTRLNVADVAFAFGLDPMTLGAGLNNSATYSNLRDAWDNHRDFGLNPWIAAVQDTLSALLAGTQAVTVNLDGFANPTAAERFATYATATGGQPIITVDEARANEGLPALAPPDMPPPNPAQPTPPEEAAP